MKINKGNWVEVTIRRLDGPDVQRVGKVVDATREYVVADCAGTRFVMSDDTFGYVFMRRMSAADWQRRKRR